MQLTERCAAELLTEGMWILLDPNEPDSQALLLRIDLMRTIEAVDIVAQRGRERVQTRLPWGATVVVLP